MITLSLFLLRYIDIQYTLLLQYYHYYIDIYSYIIVYIHSAQTTTHMPGLYVLLFELSNKIVSIFSSI